MEDIEKDKIVKTYLFEDKTPKTIQLNHSGSAYLLIDYLPEELSCKSHNEFDQLWNLHPLGRHKIIMFEKEVEVSRFSKSYLKTWTNLDHIKKSSYMYSGFDVSSNNDPLPEAFEDYYNYMREKDCKYNQVIANWYEDKSDYIANHSDCMRGMIPNANISMMSFYRNLEPENFRFIRFKPKSTNTDYIADTIKIRLDHGSIITICGVTNNEFVHGVPKESKEVCERISLSYRQMNCD